MKYTFTAIFTPEENGAFSVHFPDLPSCHTYGDNLTDAVAMAQDVLCLWLYDMEQDKKTIPTASNPSDMKVENQAFISVIAVDTDTYRRMYENKSIKKTLTVPMWLNHQAENANAPFSQILQQGLKSYLGIQEGPRP